LVAATLSLAGAFACRKAFGWEPTSLALRNPPPPPRGPPLGRVPAKAGGAPGTPAPGTKAVRPPGPPAPAGPPAPKALAPGTAGPASGRAPSCAVVMVLNV